MIQFLVLIVAIVACIGLIFVTQKGSIVWNKSHPPVALNPVFGIENEENPYDVIGVPLKEED